MQTAIPDKCISWLSTSLSKRMDRNHECLLNINWN